MIPENYSTISLFGIEMNPPRGFAVGNLDIRLYGIVIALGLILAVAYALRQKKHFGLTEDQLLDGVLIIVPISIICARLFYCIFEWDAYKNDPVSILYIWQGGLAIYGAIIGALVSVFVYCRVRKISVGATMDLTVLGFLIGQALGRWGNFFNREAVGQLAEGSNWFLKMGLLNKYTGQFEYFHPTFLYESVWNTIGFVLLHLFRKKRQYDGQIALMYCAWAEPSSRVCVWTASTLALSASTSFWHLRCVYLPPLSCWCCTLESTVLSFMQTGLRPSRKRRWSKRSRKRSRKQNKGTLRALTPNPLHYII